MERNGNRIHPLEDCEDTSGGRPDEEGALSTRSIQAFCSMRFNAQGPQKEANELKKCLNEHAIHLNIIDVKAGYNITKAVFETMVQCDVFIAMATKDYGVCADLACFFCSLRISISSCFHAMM